jgi:2'-5' RNA ligase
MKEKHRIFIAINLPADVKRALSKYQEKWPDLPAKWTAKDNLHITLEFLGDLTEEELGEVCVVTKEVAKRHSSFSIDLNKVLYGPSKKLPPKMVWAEGEKSDDLLDLKEDLQECLLEKIAFRPEIRGFVPHITLARIKEWEWKKIEPEERPEVSDDIDLIFTIESIEVMESVLKKGGPEYTVIESHSLRES